MITDYFHQGQLDELLSTLTTVLREIGYTPRGSQKGSVNKQILTAGWFVGEGRGRKTGIDNYIRPW
jgi:hypothetical protein